MASAAYRRCRTPSCSRQQISAKLGKRRQTRGATVEHCAASSHCLYGRRNVSGPLALEQISLHASRYCGSDGRVVARCKGDDPGGRLGGPDLLNGGNPVAMGQLQIH